jgi:DNA processing protein
MAAKHPWQDWLRLMHTAGVGNDTARKLLLAFGLPEQVFQATYVELSNFVSSKVANALLIQDDSKWQERLDSCEKWIQQQGNFIITLADSEYPKSLLEIPDPPVMLYVKGRMELLSAKTIAIVGSRNASIQGIQNAEYFAQSLSESGVTISSGLASGIDTAAHLGGLRGSGSTIAVIGTGADIVYPARNRQLAHIIAENGCIVSEYPIGTPAIAGNFPRRNRIISGLASGVLVVEAAAQSGSLITARMALEQGRDVFAIPGSIHSPLAKGCHQLIKQGAKLVETAQDILDEIQVFPSANIGLTGSQTEDESDVNESFLDKIGYDPVHLDVLAERTELNMATLSMQLLELELQGYLVSLPGGMVQRLGKNKI